ncbi:MAG: leucyl/phenylalanyl-tRNA--protein transferase [Ferruginibacter sp.]|nr:leucyl/phenylalanyl-tRNA--protein transferase [Cytophagales bacterium]
MPDDASITALDLIYGYRNGIFPMADSQEGQLYWYAPDPRAIIPIDTYQPARSLRPLLNQRVFDVRINTAFERVMRECAAPREGDDKTWISDELIAAYTELHRLGHAHSVEAYYEGQLAGGLYGVALGGAFFGESMFFRQPNASKVAFHRLMEILRQQGYELLDTQFINDNVRRFGAIEVPRAVYRRLLRQALPKKVRFVDSHPSALP